MVLFNRTVIATKQVSCTSLPNEWAGPSQSALEVAKMKQVSAMSFGVLNSQATVPLPTEEERQSFLDSMVATGLSLACLAVAEGNINY